MRLHDPHCESRLAPASQYGRPLAFRSVLRQSRCSRCARGAPTIRRRHRHHGQSVAATSAALAGPTSASVRLHFTVTGFFQYRAASSEHLEMAHFASSEPGCSVDPCPVFSTSLATPTLRPRNRRSERRVQPAKRWISCWRMRVPYRLLLSSHQPLMTALSDAHRGPTLGSRVGTEALETLHGFGGELVRDPGTAVKRRDEGAALEV
jgi:hypothetical protein